MFGLLLQLNFRKLCQLNLGQCCCAVTHTKGHSESGIRVLFPLLLSRFCTAPLKIKRWVRKYPSSGRDPPGWQGLGSSVPGGVLFPLFHVLCSIPILLEDHWGVEHNLVIPGGSIHALLSNFLNTHSDFSVSVEPKLLLGEALLGCFLELPLNYLILVTV